MTGKTYHKLRKQLNKDAKLSEQLAKYEALKGILKRHIKDFDCTENLFNLVEAMRVGQKILQKEGFPLDEFAKYNFNGKK